LVELLQETYNRIKTEDNSKLKQEHSTLPKIKRLKSNMQGDQQYARNVLRD
jgi:hypothetical protein